MATNAAITFLISLESNYETNALNTAGDKIDRTHGLLIRRKQLLENIGILHFDKKQRQVSISKNN